MTVTVSIFPIYDLARRVAGPDADVTVLVKPGHATYEYASRADGLGSRPDGFGLSKSDEEAVASARLEIMAGLWQVDSWLRDQAQTLAPRASILSLADRVPLLFSSGDPYIRYDVENAASPAADIWLDPRRAILMARTIADELARVDPIHATAYRLRSGQVCDALDALDKDVEAKTHDWQGREAVTTQAEAFVYFASRYHVRVVAPPAGSPKTPFIDVLGITAGASGAPALDSYEKLLGAAAVELGKSLRERTPQ